MADEPSNAPSGGPGGTPSSEPPAVPPANQRGAPATEPSAPATKPGAAATKPRKERRLARHLRHARTVWHDPKSLGGIIREGLLGIWRARGGGFYGLGYVVTFVMLEVKLLAGELVGSASFLEFLQSQLVEYLFRMGLMSFVNVLLAFLWPLLLLEQVGPWGLVLLAVGYFGFERGLRPRAEAMFPELRRADGADDDTGE